MTTYTIATFDERRDLIPSTYAIIDRSWPEFMLNDVVANRIWSRTERDFRPFQFFVLAGKDEIVAIGNSIPVQWVEPVETLPVEGWDWALENGVAVFDGAYTPNLLCALSIVIPPEQRGKGISQEAVKGMRKLAKQHDFEALIAPVRPSIKSLYPLTPMHHYITWKNSDGSAFDPWLRTHQRLGAEVVRVCPHSMVVEGSIAEWEQWTQMRFPASGMYIVPGALEPVYIDHDADKGRYVEPNVWMHHTL
jgi:hypothetical protein